MHTFRGRMVSHQGGEPFSAVITIDGDWVRIVAGYRRLGAWSREEINCQRITVFRFQFELDGTIHTFTPDDPAGFSEAVGAVIDLRPTTRFGLRDRVLQAVAETEREQATSDDASVD